MKKFYLTILGFTFLLSSCAFHHGYLNNSTALSSNNFTIKGQAKGDSKITYVIGFGGLSKTALVAEAKQNMMYNYPLREGEAYANTTVDVKNSFVLFVRTVKVTITADIIKFNK